MVGAYLDCPGLRIGLRITNSDPLTSSPRRMRPAWMANVMNIFRGTCLPCSADCGPAVVALWPCGAGFFSSSWTRRYHPILRPYGLLAVYFAAVAVTARPTSRKPDESPLTPRSNPWRSVAGTFWFLGKTDHRNGSVAGSLDVATLPLALWLDDVS